jgi:hypothetical protein
MTTISYAVPVAGSTLNSIADPQVATALTTLLTWANGNVDGANVVASLTGRRLTYEASAWVPGSFGTNASYGIQLDGSLLALPGITSKGVQTFYLEAAKYAVVGKANTNLIITLEGYCGTNPAMIFTGLLATGATFAASGANISVSAGGTLTSGPSLSFSGNGQSFASDGNAVSFPALGFCMPIIALSGTTAVNSATFLTYKLWAFNT